MAYKHQIKHPVPQECGLLEWRASIPTSRELSKQVKTSKTFQKPVQEDMNSPKSATDIKDSFPGTDWIFHQIQAF